jgi:hypothetical protein
MTEIIKIMVELLSVLAMATKQVKQGRLSKAITCIIHYLRLSVSERFTKKLLGESEIEAVLARLDRLTQEEARMIIRCVWSMALWVSESSHGRWAMIA